MHPFKCSALALACCTYAICVNAESQQAASKGFIEDSSFNMLNRSLYMRRDYKHGANSVTAGASSKASGYSEEFGVSSRLLYESGYTQGTVGVGVDAYTMGSLRLDGGRGRAGIGLFNINDKGQPAHWSPKTGIAGKVRISNTEIKHGQQMVDLPVLSYDDTRLAPDIPTGTLLTMSEVKDLEVYAGRFTALNQNINSGRDTMKQNDRTLESLSLLGANYQVTDQFSTSLFGSEVKNFFSKRYLGLSYSLDNWSIDFNGYRTKSIGKAYAGELNNKLWSLGTSYTFLDAHTLGVTYQRSSGKSGYIYGIDGAGTIYVGNSVQVSDFDSKDERSWQVRYDLDMEHYGVPGLSFMTRYVRGRGADWGVPEKGSENEWNLESKYVVQNGVAKDLSFRLRYAVYRANSVQNANYYQDFNDLRLYVDMPINFL